MAPRGGLGKLFRATNLSSTGELKERAAHDVVLILGVVEDFSNFLGQQVLVYGKLNDERGVATSQHFRYSPQLRGGHPFPCFEDDNLPAHVPCVVDRIPFA
eukprot:4447135-Heterocapsa_arctica.AAC.1